MSSDDGAPSNITNTIHKLRASMKFYTAFSKICKKKKKKKFRAVTNNEKWITDVVEALQIARASVFYSQLVWSLVGSMSKMD